MSEEGVQPAPTIKVGPPTQKIIPVCDKLLSEAAKKVSKEFVFDVYDQIAPHFSHTRYKMWPKIAEFVENLKPGSFLMDAGCGNGKNLMHTEHLVRFGSDRSLPFCEMAAKNGKCDTLQCDIARDIGKAFRPGMFDAAIAIAVIHHIPTLEGRIASLKEMHRLLKHDGRALIYVWAMEQTKGSIGARTFESQDIYVPWNLQTKYVKSNAGLPEGEIVPLKRYYHVFTEVEFKELLDAVPEFRVEWWRFDSNNWTAELVAIKE